MTAGTGSPDGTGGYYPQQAYYAPGWTADPDRPPPPRRARRLVLWSVAAVVLLALVATAVVALRMRAETSPLGDVSEATTVHSRRLDVGHCVARLPEDGDVGRVDVVPCAEPHVAEVVGIHRFRSDAWPGRQRVDAEAAAACEMDSRQADAGFRAVVWTPSEASWGQDDRAGLCLAWLPDGEARGSFAAGDEVTTG
ncbi:septum formation family protein [Actinotalea sp. JY-7876]|uniref:septum formation family protein n=1 Tax=Actinotalea sp. JY-7876 TaxID=2758442 RepID=UPI0015F35A82|nr:septum formation family protein [Actinotalea sp. JY-7876]